jgi:hypothetical protein
MKCFFLQCRPYEYKLLLNFTDHILDISNKKQEIYCILADGYSFRVRSVRLFASSREILEEIPPTDLYMRAYEGNFDITTHGFPYMHL